MIILAIETSCDETAISVLESNKNSWEILSNVVSSQVKLHAKWGGVVPSLAKREHLKNLPIVLRKSLLKAGIKNAKKEIDLIAVTQGPGLEPALWTGINFAKELAVLWNKPLVPINHMEGHLFSVFLKENREENFGFPAIVLLASGGHTQLILVKDWFKYKILGETRDDAVGEAFDKVARMLKLGYPGGPVVARLADEQKTVLGNFTKDGPLFNRIVLPRPMMNTKDYDFSFSGLKTAVLYKLREFPKLTPGIKKEMCYEFQQAVIDVLISKTMRAAKEYKAKTVILGGGVVANKELRKQFQELPYTYDREHVVILPEVKFTGDNAAMIALAAYFRYKNKKLTVKQQALKADGNLRIA